MVDEPEVASEPDHPPLAVQDVAFELDQVMVALCPGITALGLIETLATARSGGGPMVTGELPLLQPERTKAETKKTTTIRKRNFPVCVGACISFPHLHELAFFHTGFKNLVQSAGELRRGYVIAITYQSNRR